MVQVKTTEHSALPTSEGTDEQTLLRDRAMRFTRALVNFKDIDRKASQRNQARLLPLHPETIEVYTAAMKDGAVFPPMVVDGTRKPYVIADGNHRLESATAAGYDSAEMLIITEATKAQVELFTYEANATHGLPTSLDERLVQGVYLVGLGNTAVDVAQALSIPERKLWAAVATKRSRQRLERLGFKIKDKPDGFFHRVASVKSDVVVVPLVKLILSSRMRSNEYDRLITQINARHSEAEQLDLVASTEKELAPFIASSAGGMLQLPKEINRLKLGLNMLRNTDPEALRAALALVDPGVRERYGRETVEALSHLIQVAAIFRK